MASRQESDFCSRVKNGRTWRRRKRRKQSESYVSSIGSLPVFVKLCQWLQRRHNRGSSRATLKPAVFKNTGRGLMTVKGLKAGETVVKIPREAMITCDDVFEDEFIGKILRHSNIKLKCMEVLSLFLIFHRCLGEGSDWKPYINSLPTSYTVPVFCLEKEINVMPEFLKCMVQKQKEDLRHCLENAKKIFQILNDYNGFEPLLSELSLLDVRWAWFTVNTRAVYMKNSDPNPFLSDEDIYALAPYLDLLNHSCTAQVEAGFSEESGCYEVATAIPYCAYEQVFINYGPHDNTKLYGEYGFILPDNPHNSVPFTLEDLVVAIEGLRDGAELKVRKDFEDRVELKVRKGLLYEKRKIIASHSIGESLSVSAEGPSWNLEVAATILLMKPEELRYWQVVYQDLYDVCHRRLVVQCLRSVCEIKLASFSLALSNMEAIGVCTEAFAFGKELVRECSMVLNNTLKEM